IDYSRLLNEGRRNQVSYVESLRVIPRHLDKVKAYYILSRDERERAKLIEFYGFESYRDLINRTALGDRQQHRRELDNLATTYTREIIDGYVVRGINRYPSLNKMPNSQLIEYSEILGAFLVGNDLKTNQVRKFLDGIRQLENKVNKEMRDEFSNEELILLKVQLTYAAAREKKVEPFKRVINAAIDKVSANGREGYNDFRKLVKFVEAIIAFHKYYGGGE
ncbi:MAG TPA: type III-A CRISPR-associated protein Csm2, partial [Cytophagaceae bacterium]